MRRGWIRSRTGRQLARAYKRSWLKSDLAAGAALSAALIPAGMAYAEAAGLPAVTGLYASVVPMLFYAVFGPSRVLHRGAGFVAGAHDRRRGPSAGRTGTVPCRGAGRCVGHPDRRVPHRRPVVPAGICHRDCCRSPSGWATSTALRWRSSSASCPGCLGSEFPRRPLAGDPGPAEAVLQGAVILSRLLLERHRGRYRCRPVPAREGARVLLAVAGSIALRPRSAGRIAAHGAPCPGASGPRLGRHRHGSMSCCCVERHLADQ